MCLLGELQFPRMVLMGELLAPRILKVGGAPSYSDFIQGLVIILCWMIVLCDALFLVSLCSIVSVDDSIAW